MRDFEIVAIVLVVFLGFGIVTGVLIVSAFARRRATTYLEYRDQRQLSDKDGRRWPGG
jgi:hypothetical protein